MNRRGLNASNRWFKFAVRSSRWRSEPCDDCSTLRIGSFQSRYQRTRTGDDGIRDDRVIDFPNHSRSYDQTRRAVRFWGHDSAIEASFFIDEDALRRIQPDAHPDASGFLNAFDCNRDLICAAAARIYVRGSRGSYNLVAANF